MQIDALTVVAQIINFLILLWLLKRLLYDRIIDAMNRREHAIRESIESASQREALARQDAERYQELCESLEATRQATLAQARREADQIRQHLREQARTEVGEQRQRWLDELAKEREHLLAELRRRIALEVSHGISRALHELADESLEKAMVDKLLARLDALDDAERTGIAQELGSGEIQVATQGELPVALRDRIEAQIRRVFGERMVEFRHAGDAGFGIEISAGGRRIGWTIDDYLTDLERDLERAMRPGDETG
jgi:F-type H+-transporting ATPase subunit b